MAALRRLEEPALRQLRIRGDLVSAIIKRAKREHCPRVSLASSLLEKRERLVVVGLTAAAVDEHLAELNLGVCQARVRGARHPGAGFDCIYGNAAAFEQHAAVPVLGCRDSLRGTAKPLRSFGVVTLHADAFSETDGKIEGSNEIACFGRALEPMARLGLLLGRAAPLEHEVRKI